jgi:hypothetical protein
VMRCVAGTLRVFLYRAAYRRVLMCNGALPK